MRDPSRIQGVLRMLEHYWRAHPDLRLGQIVGNMAGRNDPYHLEDDVLRERLERAFIAGNPAQEERTP